MVRDGPGVPVHENLINHRLISTVWRQEALEEREAFIPTLFCMSDRPLVKTEAHEWTGYPSEGCEFVSSLFARVPRP